MQEYPVLVSIKEAEKTIGFCLKQLLSEQIRIETALGRVLAEDVVSMENIPRFDYCSMDGYAVLAEEFNSVKGKYPVLLQVIDESKAGEKSKKMFRQGQAIRVMTGAVMPNGADAVIRREDVEELENEKILVKESVKSGTNIRFAGEDIRTGDLVIARGVKLKPSHLGVLSRLGLETVRVSIKPRIAVLVTGDEFVDVSPLSANRDANGMILKSLIEQNGAEAVDLGFSRDSVKAISEKLLEAKNVDAIVTSGGASMGKYDFIREAVTSLGGKIKFWQVKQRPGKPMLFSEWQSIPIFSLPGNPVSVIVSFENFVKPAISVMMGKENHHTEIEATLDESITKEKGFAYFLRAQTIWKDGGYHTFPESNQGSGVLTSCLKANSLIILPEKEESFLKGIKVQVRMIDW